jgi:hypothetical protein
MASKLQASHLSQHVQNKKEERGDVAGRYVEWDSANVVSGGVKVRYIITAAYYNPDSELQLVHAHSGTTWTSPSPYAVGSIS